MSRIRIHFYEITSEKDIKTNKYSESMQCVVCTEEMCNKKRKPILCMHCAFQACRCCYEKYFCECSGDAVYDVQQALDTSVCGESIFQILCEWCVEVTS